MTYKVNKSSFTIHTLVLHMPSYCNVKKIYAAGIGERAEETIALLLTPLIHISTSRSTITTINKWLMLLCKRHFCLSHCEKLFSVAFNNGRREGERGRESDKEREREREKVTLQKGNFCCSLSPYCPAVGGNNDLCKRTETYTVFVCDTCSPNLVLPCGELLLERAASFQFYVETRPVRLMLRSATL